MARRKTTGEAERGSRREPLESRIQRDFIAYLTVRGWFVRTTHGNAFQKGFPDLFCFHQQWGFRWVDLKRPGKYEFTRAQRDQWPQWDAAGVGVWIVVAATQAEYDKLFAPPNWRDYWKPSYHDPQPLLERLAADYAATR